MKVRAALGMRWHAVKPREPTRKTAGAHKRGGGCLSNTSPMSQLGELEVVECESAPAASPDVSVWMALENLASLIAPRTAGSDLRTIGPQAAELLRHIGDGIAMDEAATAVLRRDLCAGTPSSSRAVTSGARMRMRALPLVVLTLQRHRENAHAQAQGFRTVRFLCMGIGSHCTDASDFGAVAAIVSGMLHHASALSAPAGEGKSASSEDKSRPAAAEVQQWGCAALKCLAWARRVSRRTMLDAGAVHALMTALEAQRGNAAVLAEGSQALENLIRHDDGAACRQHAADRGLLQLLLDVFAPSRHASLIPYALVHEAYVATPDEMLRTLSREQLARLTLWSAKFSRLPTVFKGYK